MPTPISRGLILALALASLALACNSSPTAATRETCAITIPPQPGFVPPADWMADPRPDYNSVWYGDAELWTMLDPEGVVWGERGFAKHFWFSTAFDPIEEPEPAIALTLLRLGGDEVVEQPGPATHGIRWPGELHQFMITGGTLTPGCWEITATYREAELSFIALVIADES
jgi:hypothetical protein